MGLGADPISYAVVFSAGFVSFASPCVLPLVPAYLGFVSGVALGDETAPRRRDVALPTVAFVLGFSAMFAALGAGAALFGDVLLDQRRSIEIAGGAFIIAMGLLLLGRGVPGVLLRERRIHLARNPATLAGAVLAGIAFAVGWTPCIGPTLTAILALAAAEGEAGRAALLLLTYSLGLGIPFLLTGLFTTRALSAARAVRRHVPIVMRVSGAVLVLSGVLLATGELTALTRELSGTLPELAR
jgi:cytochrome c-type biogenesis protein